MGYLFTPSTITDKHPNMLIQVHPQEFDLLYRKAKDSYLTCINNPENAYLHKETPLPLSSIVVQEWDVKVVFSARSVEINQIETHLGLYVNGKWMGKYVSITDATGEIIDDSLVFY